MNGFLYLNKPKDMTSRDVVNHIAKIFKMKKVGHTGTLDPMATGVLIVALGEATKLIDDVTSLEKEYIATATFGIETDTLDITGNILKKEDYCSFEKERVVRVLNSFLGTIEQEVPSYSAVRVNGRRLYDYARMHEKVVLPMRLVEIKKIELLDLNSTSFTFLVQVSKGTYIRSLIRDIGLKLGTPCCMSELRRTKQGDISIHSCIPLDEVNYNTKLITITTVLEKYPAYFVPDELLKAVKNGAKIPNLEYTDKVRLYDKEKNLLALYQVDTSDQTMLKAYKMFHEVI